MFGILLCMFMVYVVSVVISFLCACLLPVCVCCMHACSVFYMCVDLDSSGMGSGPRRLATVQGRQA